VPTVRKYSPSSEAELHMLIESELDGVEEGLVLLQHEYPSGKGIIDFLCVDSGNRLVIIEVKLTEDENILFQALRYFSDVDRDRYVLASRFADRGIDPEEAPRIVLVAEHFSEDVRKLSTLVVPEVELLEYSAVVLPHGEKGMVFHTVSLPEVPRLPSEPKSIDKLIEYLTNDSLKPTMQEVRARLRNLGESIEEYATQGYIGYKHPSGRQFAYIRVYRKELGVGAIVIDEDRQLLDYQETRIQAPTEDYSEAIEKAKRSFVNLGGQLAEDAAS